MQGSGEKLGTLLDLCVSSLRRGHANLLCIVPILTDDPRKVSRDDETDINHSACKESVFLAFLVDPASWACSALPLASAKREDAVQVGAGQGVGRTERGKVMTPVGGGAKNGK